MRKLTAPLVLVLLISSLAILSQKSAADTGVDPQLTLHSMGPGVIQLPDGSNCGGQCTIEVGAGAVSFLEAIPDSGARFTGWKGGCEGTNPRCDIVVNEDTYVEARFEFLNKKNPYLRKKRKPTTRSLPVVAGCGGEASCSLVLSGYLRKGAGNPRLPIEPIYFDLSDGERREINFLSGADNGDVRRVATKLSKQGKRVRLLIQLQDIDTGKTQRMAINFKR